MSENHYQWSAQKVGRSPKPGIAPKPFVPIRYDPDGSAVPARNPRRANAKQLRRAYERARQELKTIEREAALKKRKIN